MCSQIALIEIWIDAFVATETHWDTRFFVLTELRLFYFKTDSSLCPQGAVVITECDRAISEHDPNKPFLFALCGTNRKLLLQAQNLDVRVLFCSVDCDFGQVACCAA